MMATATFKCSSCAFEFERETDRSGLNCQRVLPSGNFCMHTAYRVAAPADLPGHSVDAPQHVRGENDRRE